MDLLSSPSAVAESSDSSVPKTVPPNRRRDKPQLSCNLCRKRKLRCDRLQPCQNCSRRGLAHTCTFAHSTVSERKNVNQVADSVSAGMQERIAQLESLVISLMGNQNSDKPLDIVKRTSSPASPQVDSNMPPWDPSSLRDSFGRISLENSETAYVESGHWTAILDKITELKDYFEDKEKLIEVQSEPADLYDLEEPSLLGGTIISLTKQEILDAVPPRPVVDRLVATYFRNQDWVSIVIHYPTFLKEYERFWDNRIQAPTLWLGLLFATMSQASLYNQYLANESSHITGQQLLNDPIYLTNIYREKMLQCLQLGKYTKGAPYAIETLIIYFRLEYQRNQSADTELWMLLGTIIRLALRLGYHRDGSLTPRITPFQAEMRRRVWLILIQLDIAATTYAGLTRMITETHFDTVEPRNLLDADFDENITQLPPARPDTEQTLIQFLNAKNRLTLAFGRIFDLTTLTRPYPYSEVMRLDRHLNEVYEIVPEILRVRPMSKSIFDSSDLIMSRIYIALLFHKSQCILHRKYIVLARTDTRYAYSRNACIEAALTILQYQSTLDQETQPGGRMYNDRWRITPLIQQEFLLATTLLCLDLDNDMKSDPPFKSPDRVTREREIRALEGSYLVWQKLRDMSRESREAQKASEVLRIMLGKVNEIARAGGVPLRSEHLATQDSISSMYHSAPARTGPFTSQPSKPPPPSTKSKQSQNTSSFLSFDIDFSNMMTDPFDLPGNLYMAP